MHGLIRSTLAMGRGTRLAEKLRKAGAMVAYHVLLVGHSITSMDQEIAKESLGRVS